MNADGGVVDLARSLKILKNANGLDEISATTHLPNGDAVTLRWVGSSLEIENEHGQSLRLDGEGIR